MTQILAGLRLALLAAAAVAASAPAAQPAYPSKPIRLIVPIAAGGPTDAVARALAKGLTASLGQNVAVENKPGANGALGAAAVLAAAPDGYTLFFAMGANAGLPALSKSSPYKSLNEFTPVTTVGGTTQCLVVHPSLPATTLAEFVAHARSRTQPLHRGANNAAEDMVAGQLTQATGLAFERVPYKGGSHLMPDLLEGRVQLAILPVGMSAQYVKAGRLKMLGCSAAQRVPMMPDVPTFAEAGISGAMHAPAHFVLGPPAMPAEIAERLSAQVLRVIETADYQREMERLYITGRARSPAETRALVEQLEAAYAQFARDSGASID